MITVRPAAPDERSALQALQFRASIVWDEYRQLILADPDAIELPLEQLFEGRVYVAERATEVVGFGVVLLRNDGHAELDGLFVEPALWRQGIGARLVSEAERRSVDYGARSLHVIANPKAEAFYLACGFRFAGEEQTQFGIARRMKKPLIGPDRRRPLE